MTHSQAEKLPAVSGSSGNLVVESMRPADDEPDYPGRVFENKQLSYTEAMEAFVAASQKKETDSSQTISPVDDEQMSLKAKKRVLNQQQEALRSQRRAVRQKRKEQDAAFKLLRQQRRQELLKLAPKPPQRRKEADVRWTTLRQQRKQTLYARQEQDQTWRQKRSLIKSALSQLPLVTAWIAILVITDNCTRQCLGLPLFTGGAKVTSQLIVEALKQLLPVELLFLISDRGPQFRSKLFEKLAKSQSFIHVTIARHRPESNGIAEERYERSNNGCPTNTGQTKINLNNF